MSKEQHEIKKEAIAELNRMSKANGGKITPEALVAAARSEDSPLHSYFEWDNDVAAEKYRMMQARTLLRSCHYKVMINDRKLEVPYYVRDPEADSAEQGYVETARLRSQEDLAREVLIREFQRAGVQLRKSRVLAEFFQMSGDVDQMIDTLGLMKERLESISLNS